MGIVCLAAILLILIVVRITLVYWVHPAADKAEEQKLRIAYNTFLRDQPKQIATADSTMNYLDKEDNGSKPMPAYININTADSQTLVRLKGIGPAFAHKIVQKRKKGHRFKTVDELLDVQYLPPATFTIIKPHISTSDSTK